MLRQLLTAALFCLAANSARADDVVARSDAHAQVLLEANAKFSPEQASGLGLAQYDTQVADFGPKREERQRAALDAAKADLGKRLAAESDARVRQDIEIMLDSIARQKIAWFGFRRQKAGSDAPYL